MKVEKLILPFLLILLSVQTYSQRQFEDMPGLIAHAGGVIDGYVYTNSVEAMEESMNNGYKYVEIDLLISSDGYPVAAHDWEMFNEATGFPEYGDEALNYDEFVSRKLYGKYTPITYKEIIYFFDTYPDWILVTDKLDDVEILDSFFSRYRDRIIVESFSYDAYIKLRAVDYRAIYASYGGIYPVLANSLKNMVQGGAPIDFVTVFVSSESDVLEEFQKYKCILPLKIAACTTDDEMYIDDHLGNEFDLIYTNKVAP